MLKDVIDPKAKEKDIKNVEQTISKDFGNQIDKIDNKLKSNNGNLIIEAIPVGSIISSSLSFEELCEQTGQPNPGTYNNSIIEKFTWVPADGRNVAGSEYSKINSDKSRVIDLRGVFLRGRNQFDIAETSKVIDSQKDTEGLRRIGHFQNDQIKKHKHNYKDWYANKKAGIHSGMIKKDPGHNEDISRTTLPMTIGVDETRTKNIAINFYIKIN